MSLRITAGEFRGRVLILPSQHTTRPTSAKIRLAMFHILTHNPDWGFDSLDEIHVLDGFAGSGSLGLEALSRGAEHVTFVESNPAVQTVLQHNIKNLSVETKSTVYRCEVHRLPKAPQKMDLVFLDPPYRKSALEKALMHLQQSSWIQKGTVVVIEYAKDEVFQWEEGIETVLHRPYGQTILHMGVCTG